MIRCCRGCERRTPSCHADCPDYHTEKILEIVAKAEQEKKKKIDGEICGQRSMKVYKALRNRRR